jgi:GNAT superfamily N-acetyltransferase
VRIECITERADLIEVVARWQFDTWGHLEPGDSLAARIADLRRQAANRGQIPATFVALEGNEPLGCASVLQQDAGVFRASPRQRDLTPWLASVFVRPGMRGHGVATALVRHVMVQMAARGIPRLYLFTQDARGLYEKIGWQVIGMDHDNGLDMTIMAVDLTPDKSA